MPNYKALLKGVTAFIFDYDGVLTDGSVIMTETGEALRIANIKDGYALQLAVRKGYHVAVISGARSMSMVHRLEALKVKDVFLGVSDKLAVYRDYLKAKGIDDNQALFMGDDIPDYEVMKVAGVPTCPADAAEEIKKMAVYISPFPGGKGCVRDVIEQVLKIQGKWMDGEAFSW
jgi:3-deoxy-D-manno-octulosonate 8-phosphate phosphatase (KDO 8-P phosphatase)